MPSIKLIGLKKSYGDIKAADGLDLEIYDGEYLCLLGPTGAGKTTTLRIISGLLKPDEGMVLLNDEDCAELEVEDRKAALLSQTYALFPQLTVEENILFGLNIRGTDEKTKEQVLISMLDLVRLSGRSDAYPAELSGGMQQRTALARALASGADLLLLDEPLRALDARLRISLRKELRSLIKSLKMTAIHVTHDHDEALVMADRVAIIRQGRILQVGTPADVWDRPITPFVANFVGQSNFFTGEILKSGSVASLRTDDGVVLKARPTEMAPGTKAVLGVKIGNTDVSRDKPGYFTARVERVIFEGRNLHVDLRMENGQMISSKIPSWRRGKVTEGDLLNVHWEEIKGTVFPIPPGGLENELKVE
ncbi:MAG TPA: ABC transporter ATP-binding protein [Methanomassiliicoccales archaeon]|nr:ABC transporter ATP-binding protein [Methanomassiliicoccales archaeon]